MNVEALERIAEGPFKGYLRKHYQVIYADPPWRFRTWSETNQAKSPSRHYNLMHVKDIAAMSAEDLAADDAVLFLWVTQPMLPEALDVIRSWGFEFKTVGFVWVKMPKNWSEDQMSFMLPSERPRMGLGYYTRSGAEQCWIATRGDGYKRIDAGVEQVLHAPIQEHSRKPDEVARRIVRLTGDVPRIELFARRQMPGWASHGEEL